MGNHICIYMYVHMHMCAAGVQGVFTDLIAPEPSQPSAANDIGQQSDAGIENNCHSGYVSQDPVEEIMQHCCSKADLTQLLMDLLAKLEKQFPGTLDEVASKAAQG